MQVEMTRAGGDADVAARLRRDVRRLRAELAAAYTARDVLGSQLRALLQSQRWRTWCWPAWAVARAVGQMRVRVGQLVALADVAPAADGRTWAGDGLPQLLVPARLPVVGWVRVRATVRSAVVSRAVLYFDTGRGFNQAEHAELGPVAGVTHFDRMVPVRRPAYAVRFDPCQAIGRCDVTAFDFQPMGPIRFNGWALAVSARLRLAGPPAGRPGVGRGVRLLLRGQVGRFHQRLVDRVQLPRIVADYDRWRDRHAVTADDRRQMRDAVAGWGDAAPLISVVLPVYDIAEPYLRACLDSVLRQTYPRWQLCVADDASPSPHVRRVLAEYAGRDARIVTVRRPANGNISAASNTALELATGPYVALLDHDDELAEHALFAVAERLVADPSLDWVYTDEDKLTPDGRHYHPFFKPDWSPEYLLACMYTSHLSVYRTERVRQVGGWRSAYDGAQDYDLALRVMATGPRVAHVADVLYHWRAVPTSTAAEVTAKPDALARAGLALAAHVGPAGGRVEDGPSAGLFRVRHALPTPRPLVSLVIPTGGRAARVNGRDTWFLLECVASVRRRSTYPNLELVVVADDADVSAGLAEALAPFGVTRVPFAGPFNLARKINSGVAAAGGDWVVLLNDDVEVVTADWVEALLEYAQQPGMGAVGPQLLFPDDRLQHAGVLLLDGNPGHPFYGYPGDHPGHFHSSQVTRNWSAVTGACLMTSRDLYQSVGGFTESLPLNYNDVDYCLKLLRAGRRVACVPHARLYHHESVSKPPADPDELDTFKSLWGSALLRDPYYNPNLTTHTYDFALG